MREQEIASVCQREAVQNFRAAHSFWALLKRDLLLTYRSPQTLINPPLFFIMVASLFPLAVSPAPALLAQLAPGIIWVGALLATLLSLDNLFQSDHNDGSLQQLVLSPASLSWLCLAKVVAHWLVSGFPLVLIAPLLGLLLHLSYNGVVALCLSLLIGTPLLSLLGAIGAALIVGLSAKGILLPLLVLPLYIPPLIFATSAVSAAQAGLSISGQLAFLGALLVLGLILIPITVAAALRVGVNG